MISPVPSTIVAIIGADTTAGSTRHFLSSSGSTDETSADHSTIAATVRDTVIVICGPTPSVHARTIAAAAIVSATRKPVDISLARICGQVTQPNLSGSHGAHERRRDLGAGIAAGPDQQRDEERQCDDGLHLVLERAQHRAGVGLGHEQHEQPHNSFAPQPKWRGAEVGDLERLRAALAFGVPGRFGVDDVGRRVGGEHAEQPALVVDHRQRGQVVVDQRLGGLLGVDQGTDPDGILAAQFRDGLVGLGQHQVLEFEETGQPAFGVGHVDQGAVPGPAAHLRALGTNQCPRLGGRDRVRDGEHVGVHVRGNRGRRPPQHLSQGLRLRAHRSGPAACRGPN